MKKIILIIFIIVLCSLIKTNNSFAYTVITFNDSVYVNNDSLNLAPEEVFSTTIINDFLGEENDEDLQSYLEEEIFPLVQNSDKISFDKISTSLYLLQYVLNNQEYYYIIQKFYDAKDEDIYYEKTQTQLNAIKIFINK